MTATARWRAAVDDAEQRLDLARLERRGRLVHDDDPRVDGDGPGEGDHLLRAEAELPQRRRTSTSMP